LGYLGARDLKTPNIDRLAAGGKIVVLQDCSPMIHRLRHRDLFNR